MHFFSNADFLDYSCSQARNEYFQIAATGEPLCEMTRFENAFLIGLLNKYRPKNIIEIGLSAGATTVMLLDCIKKNNLGSKLMSLDIRPMWYKDPTKPTCFLAQEEYKNNQDWTLITGQYLPQILNNYDQKFDFCILDTAHSLPGELIDFIAILPFMKNGGILVLHDIQWHMYSGIITEYTKLAYATKLVLDSAVGEKIICRDPNRRTVLPNIGALVISDDTRKYINNTISCMSMPWEYPLNDVVFSIYEDFYKKYYDDEVIELFRVQREMATNQFEQVRSSNLFNNILELETYISNIKNVSEDQKRSFAEVILKHAVNCFNQGLNLSAIYYAKIAAKCGISIKNLNYLCGAAQVKQGDSFGAITSLSEELKSFPDNKQAFDLLQTILQKK